MGRICLPMQEMKIPWRRAWQPSPLFLPEESHGQRALVGYKRVGHDSATKQQQQKFKTVGSGIPICTPPKYQGNHKRNKAPVVGKLASLEKFFSLFKKIFIYLVLVEA